MGDVVLLKDETLVWPLALVMKTYPGSDGLVRVVDLRCNGRLYNRPVHRLVLFALSEATEFQLLPGEDVLVSGLIAVDP